MELWQLYGLVLAVNLNKALIFVTALCVPAAIVGWCIYADSTSSRYDSSSESRSLQKLKFAKNISGLLISLVLLCSFIPNEKQMAFIFAGSYLSKSEAMKEVSKTPSKAVQYMNLYIDAQIKDLKADAEETVNTK